MPKVLIIEDNETNRDMLSRRLRRLGFDVSLAVDGRSGIAAAEREQPDIILMDISLGEMDGWEATQRLKQRPVTASIPVIALTAHALASDRDKSLQVGCVDFDTKPVDVQRLVSKIYSALLGTAA